MALLKIIKHSTLVPQKGKIGIDILIAPTKPISPTMRMYHAEYRENENIVNLKPPKM